MSVRTHEVFGIRTSVSDYSYIDRGKLDEEIRNLSGKDQHIALRGESKTGKSWLRQKMFPQSNVVPCRLDFKVDDIYRRVLANLEISITVEKTTQIGGQASFSASTEVGWKLLAKASGELSVDGTFSKTVVKRTFGKDEHDLEFISNLIKGSGKKVIIEDFHYLAADVQRALAHELKTLWDYGTYVVLVGVWHRKNYMTSLNPDLAGRISEVSVEWTQDELAASVAKGSKVLNVEVDEKIQARLAADSYNNIGILQSLALNFFERSGIHQHTDVKIVTSDGRPIEDAGMTYADQLEAVYSVFAERVSDGMRKRKNATQIYAYAMWSIMEATDDELIKGLPLDVVFQRANKRQPRIQKQNLRTVLSKFKDLQADDRGKGVVITFDEPTDCLVIVDRGLLFYRKYSTRKWPWQDLAETGEAGFGE